MLASLFNPTCGVPSVNLVDQPNGARIVDSCARLEANINGVVALAMAGVLLLLSFTWTQSDGNGGQQPVIPLYWIALPLLLGAATYVLSPMLAINRFRTEQDNFVSSGMSKSAWLVMRAQQKAAAQQAAAVTGAGLDIAGAVLGSGGRR
jgi:hypothetical protein